MATKLIPHLNFIGHEINESLQFGYPDSDREVYCKKLHKITEPDEKDCDSCPYFAGWMQGHGHECVWEDVVGDGAYYIPHKDRNKEFLRVSRLIDEGVLKKG